MGFISTHNTIFNSDVDIKSVNRDFYISNIKQYEETSQFKVQKPTLDIVHLFWGKIKFICTTTQAACINNNRLEIFNILPNFYQYQTFEEVIKHLSDPSKEYYLSKVTFGSIYSLYVVEKSILATSRDQKLEQLLAE